MKSKIQKAAGRNFPGSKSLSIPLTLLALAAFTAGCAKVSLNNPENAEDSAITTTATPTPEPDPGYTVPPAQGFVVVAGGAFNAINTTTPNLRLQYTLGEPVGGTAVTGSTVHVRPTMTVYTNLQGAHSQP